MHNIFHCSKKGCGTYGVPLALKELMTNLIQDKHQHALHDQNLFLNYNFHEVQPTYLMVNQSVNVDHEYFVKQQNEEDFDVLIQQVPCV